MLCYDNQVNILFLEPWTQTWRVGGCCVVWAPRCSNFMGAELYLHQIGIKQRAHLDVCNSGSATWTAGITAFIFALPSLCFQYISGLICCKDSDEKWQVNVVTQALSYHKHKIRKSSFRSCYKVAFDDEEENCVRRLKEWERQTCSCSVQ